MNHPSDDRFSDIRPYRDNEVQDALQRLCQDTSLIRGLLKFRFGRFASHFEGILVPLAKAYLRFKIRNINTVEAIQNHVAAYVARTIQKTTQGVTYSGLEHLNKDIAYLFVSNHRDIAMDPTFVNWVLYQNNFPTVNIAIGDNLLRQPSATDLMKLNKSFLVKRSAKGPREMIKAYGELSAYIKHTLSEQQSIWIAQREGRAKDGNDRTEPALLKMFYMEGKKRAETFTDYMQQLNIVPVAISYEFDPCAIAKAREMHAVQTTGTYEKSEMEDIDSIIRGILGQKGRVHVHFGQPLTNLKETSPEALATHIDHDIHQGYHLFPSHLLAAGVEEDSIQAAERQAFVQHMAQCPRELTQIILNAYAKPVQNQRKMHD